MIKIDEYSPIIPKEAGEPLDKSAIDMAKDCYDKHIKDLLTIDEAKKMDKYLQSDIFENPDTLKVCNDKEVQKNVSMINNKCLFSNYEGIKVKLHFLFTIKMKLTKLK